jgi:hypothetical protein
MESVAKLDLTVQAAKNHPLIDLHPQRAVRPKAGDPRAEKELKR